MTFLPFTKKLAQQAGKLILKEAKKGFKIEEKAKNDFVTEVDKKAEDFIVKEILKKYPDHAILAEESSFQKDFGPKNYNKSSYIWIIDPIDGTNNFMRQIPYFAVSIALFELKKSKKSKNFDYLEGELLIGAIYAPAFDKLFYAEKGKGAYLNDKKIEVSKTGKLERSILGTGFHGKYKEMNLPYFEKMITNAQGHRRNGSAVLDLCAVAEGKHEGYWEFGLKPWDIAAGALIVKEAGGLVTDTNGNLLDLFGKDLLATNGKIHKEILKTFSN